MPNLKKNNFYLELKKVLRFHQHQLLVLSFSFGTFFTYLFSHMLDLRPTGLYAGHVHVWGDWSLHLAMASIFAYKEPNHWFTNHPYFGGGKLTYGFLTNMISGLLIRAGWSIPNAFLLPSILYCFLLLIGMYFVYYQILNSKNLSITAVSLFFLSSGHGFIRLFQAWWKNPSWDFLLFAPKDFSRIEPQYQWLAGNFVNGMLIPQRAFLLGMTIAVWSLAILIYVFRHQPISKSAVNRNRILLLVSGLLAGLLPIVHMHSLMVLIIITGLMCLTEYKRWRELAFFVTPAGILSALLYFKFVSGGIENPDFMKILIGWTAPKARWGWPIMWWRIWGIFTPLALIGLGLERHKPWRTKFFYLGFFVVFILANLIVFQPIHWDNSKMFMWAYFGWCALVATTLRWLIHRSWPWKTIAIVLYFTVTLTGLFELMRLTRIDRNTVMITSTEEMRMGEFLRRYTDEETMFLTNASHNHPISLWGARPILLGYPAWAYNFGFLYEQRLADMRTMYAGNSQSLNLLKKYQVDFVAIGSGEKSDLQADENFFRTRFTAIYADQNYRIYDVRELKNEPSL